MAPAPPDPRRPGPPPGQPRRSGRDPGPRLPSDAGAEGEDSSTSTGRAARPGPGAVGLVVLGGTVGTALREVATLLLPRPDGFPVPTLAVNLGGAFLLGLLLETLLRRGPDAGRRRRLRLLLGTGVLGGFTTYSALSVDTVLLGPLSPVAAAYLAATLVLGAGASLAGITVAARRAPGPRGGAR